MCPQIDRVSRRNRPRYGDLQRPGVWVWVANCDLIRDFGPPGIRVRRIVEVKQLEVPRHGARKHMRLRGIAGLEVLETTRNSKRDHDVGQVIAAAAAELLDQLTPAP